MAVYFDPNLNSMISPFPFDNKLALFQVMDSH